MGALLMGPDGGFITGSDILMDGGVTAAYWYGDLARASSREEARGSTTRTAPRCQPRAVYAEKLHGSLYSTLILYV